MTRREKNQTEPDAPARVSLNEPEAQARVCCAAISPVPGPGGGGDAESSRQRGRGTGFPARVLTLIFLALIVAPALAQHPIPEAERWATITHPGNEAHPGFPGFPPRSIGRVDHEYQISRTELTGAEWYDFVLAYAPYVASDLAVDNQFISNLVRASVQGPPYTYTLVPNGANYPVRIGWRFAARYCNWLHNDKRPEQAAFESGAYDTSTFGTNPDGTLTDQVSHTPDARYWIPSEDEWVKSAYFDPNRYGLGQPGYWKYPHSSDEIPIPGMPNSPTEPGQTSAGWESPASVPPVAAYTNVQSPWGLFDLSGSEREWVENANFIPTGGFRWRTIRGTDYGSNPIIIGLTKDYIDWPPSASGPASDYGVRLARAVPSPSTCIIVAVFAMFTQRRHRPCCVHDTSDSSRRSVWPDLAAACPGRSSKSRHSSANLHRTN